MGHVIAGQTISLDGFVADANGSAEPLYPDLEALRGSAYMDAMIAETGAVVMGRRSFEMPDSTTSSPTTTSSRCRSSWSRITVRR